MIELAILYCLAGECKALPVGYFHLYSPEHCQRVGETLSHNLGFLNTGYTIVGYRCQAINGSHIT